RREDLRGLALAALWDAGARARARDLGEAVIVSRTVANVAWGALVRAADGREGVGGGSEPLVTESALRWVQRGWVEESTAIRSAQSPFVSSSEGRSRLP